MSAHDLKSLQVRKAQIESELNLLRKTFDSYRRDIDSKVKALQQVERQITFQTKMKPQVSEHAMLRYCERVLGINLKEVEADILTQENIRAIDVISSGRLPYKNDLILIVRNKTVATIIQKDAQNERPRETQQDVSVHPPT